MRPTTAALALTLTSAVAAATFAASPAKTRTTRQAAPDSGITLHVTTRETIVDVTVTDSQGNPVHNLKREDFTLKEDRKPEPLRGFQEFSKESLAAAQTAPAKLPPNIYTNCQPAIGPLNILLLPAPCGSSLDALPIGKAAVKLIKTMAPGTQVAIFRLSCGLNLVQGPTSDKTTLLEALARNYTVPPPDQCARVAQAKNWIYPQQCMLEDLNQIASYVSGIKGRKNLLWVNSGVSSLVFPDTHIPGSTRELLPDFTKDLQRTYSRMAMSQVAIYPVDLTGVRTIAPLKPGTAGRSAANADMAWLRQVGNDHLSFEAVAEATGGEALYNLNDLAALMGKAVEHGANYYSLSYVPESAVYDGRYHSINVKVDRPGVHVVFRKGYTAENTFSSPAAGPTLMQADMGPGAPAATQLLFDARVDPLPASNPASVQTADSRRVLPSLDKATAPYGVFFALPASQITFTPGPDGTYTGSLEFDVAAYAPGGKLANLISQTLKLPLTAGEYQEFLKKPFQFFQQLDLPPGPVTLRIGILDGVSNKIGTLEVPLTVPKTPPDRAATQPNPPTK